ncbi:MAG TPA: hypothetical protein VK796_12780 [Cytophaga sp.]|jgi:hypothetical protein|nr:hypothetical protein [Cytophaga sp.]
MDYKDWKDFIFKYFSRHDLKVETSESDLGKSTWITVTSSLSNESTVEILFQLKSGNSIAEVEFCNSPDTTVDNIGFVDFSVPNGFIFKQNMLYNSGSDIPFSAENINKLEEVLMIALHHGWTEEYYYYKNKDSLFKIKTSIKFKEKEDVFEYEFLDIGEQDLPSIVDPVFRFFFRLFMKKKNIVIDVVRVEPLIKN